MNDIKFGKYLKRVRKKYNFSKEYVANILKVKESLVSDWESGKLTLNDEYMEKLISISFFLYIVSEKEIL